MKKTYLLITLVISISCLGFMKKKQDEEKKLVPLTSSALLEYEKNTISVSEKVTPSVVSITNIQKAQFGLWGRTQEVPAGFGSGFVWDDQGHIVTNYHVIKDGSNFLVSFDEDQKQYKAKLIGSAPRKDIAVLKVLNPPKNLKPVTPGDSSKLLRGQKAVALGNPFQLEGTLTVGVISALGRTIQGIAGLPIYDVIQTDAAINPGNSGGPLMDSQGRVIAMNTLIVSSARSSAGLGFGVPINTIKDYVPQIIKNGKVIRPGLGILFLEDSKKESYFPEVKGLIVRSVQPNGPAAKAGIQGSKFDNYGKFYIGDVITALKKEGARTFTKIGKFTDLYKVLDKAKVGETYLFKYLRKNQGSEQILSVKLEPLN